MSAAKRSLRYPTTKKVMAYDSYDSEAIADAFRWLEEDSHERSAWFEAQSQLAHEQIAHNPYCEPFLARIAELPSAHGVPLPRRCGRYVFTYRIHSGTNKPILWIRKASGGTDRVLLDPTTLPEPERGFITAWYPSPDGRYVAVRISPRNNDTGYLRIIETEPAAFLPETVPADLYPVLYEATTLWSGLLVWSPERTGFWYVRCSDPETPKQNFKVFFHRLRTNHHDDTLVFGSELGPRDFPALIHLDDSGRYLTITATRASLGWDDHGVWLIDLSRPKRPPRCASTRITGFSVGKVHRGHLYLWTTHNANMGTIVRSPIEKLAAGNAWTIIAPECSQRRILNFTPVGEHLVIHWYEAGLDSLEIVGLRGMSRIDVSMPLPCAIISLRRESASAIRIQTTSLAVPLVDYSCAVMTGHLRETRRTEIPGLNPGDYRVNQVWVTSGDGTELPLLLFSKGDPRCNEKQPVIMSVYGAYGRTHLKSWFLDYRIPILDAGGLYVAVGARGGGELGASWHEQGRLHLKQNTLEDCAAAACWLARNGYTEPRRIALFGVSSGGTTALAAIMRYPNNFGCGVAHLALSDMMRFHLTPDGAYWKSEYGDPDCAEDRHALLTWSPLHAVKSGVRYPPILAIASLTDDRVPAWHAAKMIASLQRTSVKRSGPFLLSVVGHAPHGLGSTVPTQSAAAHVASCLSWAFAQIA